MCFFLTSGTIIWYKSCYMFEILFSFYGELEIRTMRSWRLLSFTLLPLNEGWSITSSITNQRHKVVKQIVLHANNTAPHVLCPGRLHYLLTSFGKQQDKPLYIARLDGQHEHSTILHAELLFLFFFIFFFFFFFIFMLHKDSKSQN